ncbi:hypothetical protein ColKHC_02149 [Colletotrichum higginsianum]|nr:hypothetical protein ColKHC_02149 [Colletotrichum higginsianum]
MIVSSTNSASTNSDFCGLMMCRKGTSTRRAAQNQERNSEAIMLSTPKPGSALRSSTWSSGSRIRLEKRFFIRLRMASCMDSAAASGGGGRRDGGRVASLGAGAGGLGGLALGLQRGEEQGGAGLDEDAVGGDVEAAGRQGTKAVGLETREQVGLSDGTLLLAGEGQVDNLQQLVLVEGLDALAEQQGLDLRVLVEVADLGDHAEPNGDAGLAAGAAPAGKGVEEAVGGAVVALGGGADGAGDGRGEQEEVELLAGGAALDGVVQVPGALPLGLDARVPGLVGHAGEEGLVQAHGGLDDTADLATGGEAGGHGGGDVGGAADVAADDVDGGARVPQAGDELLGVGPVGAGAAEEDEVAGAAGHHPPAQTAAETAEAADEEVDLVGVEAAQVGGRRDGDAGVGVLHGDDDLADAVLVAEEAVGLGDLGDVEDARGQGLDLAGAVELQGVDHEAVPDGAVVGVLCVEELREVEGGEGGALEERAHVEAAGVDELALADLDEAAKVGEAGLPTAVHEVADEGVEDDVDAAAAGGLGDAADEGVVARAEDVRGRHAELVDEVVALGLGAAGRVDDGAHLLGHGDGGDAEAAGAGVHEDGLALAEVGAVVKGVERGGVDDEERRHHGELLVVKERVDAADGHAGRGADVEGRVGDDPVADLERRRCGAGLGAGLGSGADGRDNTGEVKGRRLVAGLDAAAHGVDVLGVETDGLDLDVDEAGRGGLVVAGLAGLLEVHGIGDAGAADGEAGRVGVGEGLGVGFDGLGVEAAAEERVDLDVRAVAADVEEAVDGDELGVVLLVEGDEAGEDVAAHLGGDLGGVLVVFLLRLREGVADVEHRPAQPGLLEHHGAREAVGEREVGVRLAAEHVGARDPEEIGHDVGDGAQTVHGLRAQRGEELGLGLEQGDADVVLLDLDRVELVQADDAGFGNIGGGLQVGGQRLGELVDDGRGTLGLDDDGGAPLQDAGWGRAHSKQDLGSDVQDVEAGGLETGGGGLRLANDDDAAGRQELGDAALGVVPDSGLLGGAQLGDDDNVKGALGAVLDRDDALVAEVAGVPRAAAREGRLLVEHAKPLVRLVALAVAADLEDAHARLLVAGERQERADDGEALVVAELVDDAGHVLAQRRGGSRAKTEHVRLPLDAEGRLALRVEGQGVSAGTGGGVGGVGLARGGLLLLRDGDGVLAGVAGHAAVLEVDDEGAARVTDGSVDAAAREAHLLGADVDLALGIGGGRLDLYLGEEDGQPGPERGDVARGAAEAGGLEPGVDGDGVDRVELAPSTVGSILAVAMASRRLRALSVCRVVRERNWGPKQRPSCCHLVYQRPVEAQRSKPSASATVVQVWSTSLRSWATRMLPVQWTVAWSEVQKKDEMEKSCQSAEALAPEILRRDMVLEVLGRLVRVFGDDEGRADVYVAQLEADVVAVAAALLLVLLELLLDARDLGHGLDGHGHVPGRREDDLVLELVVLDPRHLVGPQAVAPRVVDAVAREGRRAEQLVAEVLPVAQLDARAGLVPEEAGRVVPGVRGQRVEGAEVLPGGGVDLVDVLPVDAVALDEEGAGERLEARAGVLLADEGGRVGDRLLVEADGLADLLDGALEGRVRADLDEVDLLALGALGEGCQGGAELDGLLEVLAPAASVSVAELLEVESMTRRRSGLWPTDEYILILASSDSLDEDEKPESEPGTGQQLLVQGADLLHHVRVVGATVGLELAGELLLALQLGLERVDGGRGAAEGDALGRVDAGDAGLGLEPLALEEVLGLLRAEAGGHHAALGRQVADGVAAEVGDEDGLRGAEEAGGVGSGHLAGRVADDGRGLDAVAAEQVDEADLDGRADGLAARGVVDLAGLGPVEERLLERPRRRLVGGQRLEDLVEAADGVEEVLALGQQLLGHAGVLGALAREDEAEGQRRRPVVRRLGVGELDGLGGGIDGRQEVAAERQLVTALGEGSLHCLAAWEICSTCFFRELADPAETGSTTCFGSSETPLVRAFWGPAWERKKSWPRKLSADSRMTWALAPP